VSDLFAYDPETRTLRFLHPNAETVLSGWLTRGKFGDYLDDILLLNDSLARFLQDLSVALPKLTDPTRPQEGIRQDPALLFAIGDRIASHGDTIGWWQKSTDEQRTFISSVVAAPHVFCEEDIDLILQGVDNVVHRARRLVKQASPEQG
jgi:hypothetical protein